MWIVHGKMGLTRDKFCLLSLETNAFALSFLLLFGLTADPSEALSLRMSQGVGWTVSAGRVEIFDGNYWGVICLDNQDQWTVRTASVACRQMGYPSALSATNIRGHIGITSYVVTRNILCRGTESKLEECTVFELSQTYGCKAGRSESAVVCKPHEDTFQKAYLLELHNGSNSTEGDITVKPIDETWTICADASWDIKAATVVCQELGMEYAKEATGGGHFGTESGWVVVGSVRCFGGERHILECSHTIMEKDSCKGSVAGVRCSNEPSFPPGKIVRLVGSPYSYEGHVQTFYNGNWWNICTNKYTWFAELADVTCNSLGWSRGKPLPTLPYSKHYIDTKTDDFLISQVICNSHHTDLSTCQLTVSYHTKCGYYDQAAVRCYEENEDLPYSDVPLRLSDGDSMASGRLELFWDYKWYTMCDSSDWDINAATVVCHQLGFADALSTGRLPLRGEATADIGIMYYQAACTGMEKSLQDCSISDTAKDCSHAQDVSVTCSYLPYDEERARQQDEGDPRILILILVVIACIIIGLGCCIWWKRKIQSTEAEENGQGHYDPVTTGAAPQGQPTSVMTVAPGSNLQSDPPIEEPPPAYDQVNFINIHDSQGQCQ